MKPKILLSVKQNGPIYEAALQQLGAQTETAYLPEVSTDYDGLLLCGGDDVDPKYYNQKNIACSVIDPARDERELALADAFIKAGKPVMGICRGLQLLNVYFGGTLYQHIEQVDTHRQSKEHYCVHPAQNVEGQVLYRLYGPQMTVNSYHHQAVQKLGKGLIPVSYADGVIEAVVHESLPILAVQWHPEKMSFAYSRPDASDGKPVLEEFVKMCSSFGQDKV